MALKLKNNATSVLASAINVTDTTLTVLSGTGERFPVLNTNDYFYATIQDTANNFEIVKVVGRTNDVMVIQRAQEDTIARSFPAGSRIELRVTVANIIEGVQGGGNIQVSGTNRVLGRVSPGGGSVEEIPTTGSGDVVRAVSPRLVTPDLGTPSALTLTNAIGLPPAGVIGTAATLNNAQTFNGAQRGAVTVLISSGGSIIIDLSVNNNFSHTTTEDTTFAAPLNPVAGQSGVITITQGATPRTLTFNSFWKFPGGTVPTLTQTAGAVDVFVYYVESSTRATCRLIKDVK